MGCSRRALRLATWYHFEPFNWFFADRANVHVIDSGWNHIRVPTASGRPYDGTLGQVGGLCHLDRDDSWAGDLGTSWATTDFDLSPWAGQPVRIEVNYNTNASEICEGIYLDDLELSGVLRDDCDVVACAPVCTAPALPPLQALHGVKVGASGIRWHWQDPAREALEYHVNSVLARSDLGATDPASPRQSPAGRGTLECTTTAAIACDDPDARPGAAALVFYQALPACGPTGADEGGV